MKLLTPKKEMEEIEEEEDQEEFINLEEEDEEEEDEEDLDLDSDEMISDESDVAKRTEEEKIEALRFGFCNPCSYKGREHKCKVKSDFGCP